MNSYHFHLNPLCATSFVKCRPKRNGVMRRKVPVHINEIAAQLVRETSSTGTSLMNGCEGAQIFC